jgi:hypothetical protein
MRKKLYPISVVSRRPVIAQKARVKAARSLAAKKAKTAKKRPTAPMNPEIKKAVRARSRPECLAGMMLIAERLALLK